MPEGKDSPRWEAQALAVWGVMLKPDRVTVLGSPRGTSGKETARELVA